MPRYADQYRELTDDEVLHLSSQRDFLEPSAAMALDGELKRRSLDSDAAAAYVAESKALEQQEALSLKVFTVYGFGQIFYGRSNYSRDEAAHTEEFDTTLWLVLLFIPVGTYRVRRAYAPWWNPRNPSSLSVLARLRRNWGQIALTWVACLMLLFGIWRFWPVFLDLSWLWSRRS